MRKVMEKVEFPRPPTTVAGLLPWARDTYAAFARHFQEVGVRVNGALPSDGSERASGPIGPPEYLAATLPAAADYEGSLIYVSDGAAGQKLRFSDGSSWLNVA